MTVEKFLAREAVKVSQEFHDTSVDRHEVMCYKQIRHYAIMGRSRTKIMLYHTEINPTQVVELIGRLNDAGYTVEPISTNYTLNVSWS